MGKRSVSTYYGTKQISLKVEHHSTMVSILVVNPAALGLIPSGSKKKNSKEKIVDLLRVINCTALMKVDSGLKTLIVAI